MGVARIVRSRYPMLLGASCALLGGSEGVARIVRSRSRTLKDASCVLPDGSEGVASITRHWPRTLLLRRLVRAAGRV